MNILEELTVKNKENYNLYLKRMSHSCEVGSKHMIPFYTIGYKNILDVGCADGALMKAIQKVNPGAKVRGIDLNENAIKLARADGLEVFKLSLEDVASTAKKKYDCIIFSSVLHEVSSYATDYAFTYVPIVKILNIANSLLSDNGCIIIRDGLRVNNSSDKVCLYFTDPSDKQWLIKFLKDFKGFFPDNTYRLGGASFNGIVCCYDVAQEFLATWTWGEKSWYRETQEQFCLFNEDGWMTILKEAGFYAQTFTKSKEEYPKYLNPKVEIHQLYKAQKIFPYMTCTIIAKKDMN